MEGGSQAFSVDFDIFILMSKLKLLRPSFRSQLYMAYWLAGWEQYPACIFDNR